MNQRDPDIVKVAEELFAHEELTGGAAPVGITSAGMNAGRERRLHPAAGSSC